MKKFLCLLVGVGVSWSLALASDPEPSITEEPTPTEVNEPVPQLGSEPSRSFFLQVVPPPPEPPKPVPPDPLTALKDFGGQSDVSLFSGSLNFQYPLQMTAGRLGMTPQLSLSYSSNDRNFASMVGYGWNLSGSSIYRSTTHGIDQLYDQEYYTAELNGSAEELIAVDSSSGLFGAKVEGGFTKYEQLINGWKATATDGTVYTFGASAATQQADLADNTRIYKWLLERVEDLNGNFITYTYTHDQGQTYPATIRYTGHASVDDGLYEVRFVWEGRSPYTEYRRGFAVTTAKRLKSVELYRTDTNTLIYQYDLAYTPRSNAVQRLSSITQRSGAQALPTTSFTYYDGNEGLPGQRIDLLKQINYPYGATENFVYEPSTVPRANGQALNKLPFVIHTLKERQLQPEPNGAVHTTAYNYSGGHYFYDPADAYKKEYAGFHEVGVTDPLGNVTKHYFHQSEFSADGSAQGEQTDHLSKKGREYLTQTFDDQNTMLRSQWNHWSHQALNNDDPINDRYRVSLTQSIVKNYGSSGGKARATTYLYDSYGNTIEELELGEVTLNDNAGNFTDTGMDSVKHTYEYAYNSSLNLVSKLARSRVYNQTNQKVAQTVYLYDGNGFANKDLIDKGRLTHQREYFGFSPGVYLQHRYSYNKYGLVTQLNDPKNNKTKWAYDGKKLQPKYSDNALNQRTDFKYDLRFGQVKKTTDPNGLVIESDYDVFGRTIATRQSDPATPANLVTLSTTVYDPTAYPAKITDTVFTGVNGGDSVGIWYLDGLGRLVQTRQEAENSQFAVSDVAYDARGQQYQTYLPEFQTGAAYVALNPTRPKTQTTFDALDRPALVADPTGSTQLTYDGWEAQVTNKLGQTKATRFDAFGRLVEVVETNSGQSQTTTYTYDPQGNLILLTDAAGNTRAHQYDMAGRRVSQGVWRKSGTPVLATTFVYDKNGNVTTQTDPRGETIIRTYDALNRPLTETSSAGSTTYLYDTALYGIGRVASVAVPGLTKTYSYDVAGRVTSESQAIGTENFLTQQSFDWRGQPVSVTTPDGLVVNYTYGNAGQVTGVTSGPDTLAQTIEYGPHGHITRLVLGDGTETLNTFDPQQLHRLTHKVTTLGTTKLQDLAYTLDAEGNVGQIVDASNTDTAHTATYTYDDLQRLLTATVTNAANGQNYSRSYSYDAIGNQLSRSDMGTTTFAADHPHLASSDSTGVTYTYDAAGNLLSDGTWTHTWDAYGRLVSSTDGTTSVTYQYDEEGRRYQNASTANTILYVGKAFKRDDTQSKTFVFLGDLKLATKTTDLTPSN